MGFCDSLISTNFEYYLEMQIILYFSLKPKNIFQDQIYMKKIYPIHHALPQPTLRVHQISNKQRDKIRKGAQADGRNRKLKEEPQQKQPLQLQPLLERLQDRQPHMLLMDIPTSLQIIRSYLYLEIYLFCIYFFISDVTVFKSVAKISLNNDYETLKLRFFSPMDGHFKPIFLKSKSLSSKTKRKFYVR